MRAWAEARSGHREAAMLRLGEAFQTATPRYIPMYADLNRIAGEVILALGDIPTAREYFKKAAELDPNGRIGKLAQHALDQQNKQSE
jgi:hypothetical protein